MRKLFVCLGLMALLAQSALAIRPSGWVYGNYPWAYDSGSGDWYWFNTSDTQWLANMGNGQWATLPNSALASGWGFYQPPFAYAQGNSAWHYINEADTQWVVNMRTGAWSRFGQSSAPTNHYYEVYGNTNAATTSSDVGAFTWIADSRSGSTFDVSAYGRFMIFVPSASGTMYFDAFELDSRWVESAPGPEKMHVTSNMNPTDGSWATHDWCIEGSPDGVTMESTEGGDSIYTFSTLGATQLTVYTVP